MNKPDAAKSPEGAGTEHVERAKELLRSTLFSNMTPRNHQVIVEEVLAELSCASKPSEMEQLVALLRRAMPIIGCVKGCDCEGDRLYSEIETALDHIGGGSYGS